MRPKTLVLLSLLVVLSILLASQPKQKLVEQTTLSIPTPRVAVPTGWPTPEPTAQVADQYWVEYLGGAWYRFCSGGTRPVYSWQAVFNVYRMYVLVQADFWDSWMVIDREFLGYSAMGPDTDATTSFEIQTARGGGYKVDYETGGWDTSWLIQNYPGHLDQFAKDFDQIASSLHEKYELLETFWKENGSPTCTPEMPTVY